MKDSPCSYLYEVEGNLRTFCTCSVTAVPSCATAFMVSFFLLTTQGAEPLIVVNAGLGSALDAAALVAYVNLPVGLHAYDGDGKDHQAASSLHTKATEGSNSGSSSISSTSSSSMWHAKLERAMMEEPRRRWRNGEQLPWHCQWWGIGNEMYGPWQLGVAPFDAFVQVLLVCRVWLTNPRCQ